MKTTLLPQNKLARNNDLIRMGKEAASAFAIGLGMVLLLGPLSASAQQLPWETFSRTLACGLSGAWVKWLAVIAVALGGVMFGLGELSGPFQRTMQIAGGFRIALGAVAVVGMLLNGVTPGAAATAMSC